MIFVSFIAGVLSTATADYQPDDMIDVLGLLISNLAAIIAAIAGCSALVVAIRGRRAGDDGRKLLGEIHRQAVNDHTEPGCPNLRDQVDAIQQAQKLNKGQLEEIRRYQVRQGRDISGIRDDFGGLRGALRADRSELRDLERRINAFIDREHPDADPL